MTCSNVPRHLFRRPTFGCSFANPIHSLCNLNIPRRLHAFLRRALETHQKFASEFRTFLVGK